MTDSSVPPDDQEASGDESDRLYRESPNRREQGEDIDPEEYLQKYPEFRKKVEKLFTQLDIGEDDTPDRKIPANIGDFRIIKEIGRGGMGTVYEAEQITLKRKVALKVLPSHLSFSSEAVVKFRREAEAGGRQRHRGIVAIYAVGALEGVHYIAQELVEGGTTLADKLDEFKGQEELPQGYFRYVAQLIADIADAIFHAHEVGVIHRDIKPSNILLTRDGEPKVSDFGLAKIEDALALSRSGELSGTPYYMSPEQAASRRIGIDNRTDIFSLGVTLYELITLRRPFSGKTAQEVLRKILLYDPRDPRKVNPRVPRDLAVICLKAMEKKPDKRYQTMEEFAEDLQRFLLGDMITARPAKPPTLVWRRIKRNPILSASVSLAFLALVVLVGVVPWIIAQKEKETSRALEMERNKALEAQKEADGQARLAQARYDEILWLADNQRLQQLHARADTLWPAYPENVKALQKWVHEAQGIIGRIDIHRSRLNAMREAAKPNEGAVKGEGGVPWIFEDADTEWQHGILQELVQGLEGLSRKDGLIQSIKKRIAFAETVYESSIERYRGEWDEAIASIADASQCPKYAGLEIRPQIGLVPIGQNRRTGLWEFAHLQTGAITRWGSDGKLNFREDSGLVFVLIPGGTFEMGSTEPGPGNPSGTPNVDPEAESDEGPVHTVTVRPFFLSKFEMTQAQWKRFTGKNPSTWKSGATYNNKVGGKKLHLLHPVETVSWEGCLEVLSQLKLRLPSEAEWEYAARAGTTTIWYTGNERNSLEGAVNLCDLYCKENGGASEWQYEEWLDDGHVIHAPVGSFSFNPFGLHDIYGNVWEWCHDGYLRKIGYAGAPADGSPREPAETSYRCSRGGSWQHMSSFCRSARRDWHEPSHHLHNIGCRPARSIEPAEESE